MENIHFDEVCSHEQSATCKPYYGIIHGDNTIIYLKPGNRGTCFGYNNKYLKLANSIAEKYGYSVIISSNPKESKKDLEDDFRFIDDYAKRRKLGNYIIYFIGVSDGARSGAKVCFLHQNIKRVLLINGPLFIDFDKTIKGLLSFKGESLYLVYASEDPSFDFTHFVPEMIEENPVIRLTILKNQDHLLSKNNFDLFKLVDETLLKDND